MPDFVDLSGVRSVARDIRERLESRGRSVVIGRPGTGRTTLVSLLKEEVQGGHVIDLPDLGPDSAVHGLVQAGSAIADERARKAAIDPANGIGRAAANVARELARSGTRLVISLPRSWSTSWSLTEDTPFQQRALEFLESLLSNRSLEFVAVFAQNTDTSKILDSGDAPIRLPLVRPSWEMLRDASMWGSYSPHAERIQGWFSEPPRVSPIALRMAVGLLALGEQEDVVKVELAQPRAFKLIGSRLLDRLESQAHHELAKGLRRVALSRYPLPKDEAVRLSAIPENHRPLLTQCAGYGNGTVRMNGWLRERLASSGAPDPVAHLDLSRIYASGNGATSVEHVGREEAIRWLERVHHLALSGPSGENDWQRIQPAGIDQLWDRARSLSREFKDYRAAAELYRRCVEMDASSSYSWQYLGYNLERAGADRKEAEHAYVKAIELDGSNPWWNYRYVRFLIHDLRFRQAADEWDRAVERVSGTRKDSQWLAENFHLPVIHAWLKHGRSAEARKVLDRIDDDAIRMSVDLQIVRQQVLDAAESDLLGESVYPPEFPVKQRWQRPAEIPVEHEAGGRLVSWHPARAVEIEEEGVRVVFATTEDDTDERRVMARLIPAPEWELAARCTVEDAMDHVFFFIGAYQDDKLLIVPARRGFIDELVAYEPKASPAYDDAFRGAVFGGRAGPAEDD